MSRRKQLALAALAAAVCGAAFAWLWHGRPKSAATFERDLARAARGDPQAQYRLGSDYYYGRGVKQNYAEAARWYRESSLQGSAKAEYAMGYCYAYGFGVSRDVNEAIRYFRQAAGQGNPQALCQLARINSEGRDLPWNRTEAFRLYRAAADQGNACGEDGLAYLYSHGPVEERDYTEAARWALKAAAQGNARAQSYLGWAYFGGRGVARDPAVAARWFRKAADQGDSLANLFMAGSYWRGEGVSRNYLKAAYHFAKVLGPILLRTFRRYGWKVYGGLLLLIAGAFAPKRLWGRQQWLSLAVVSIAAGILLFEAAGKSFGAGVSRLIGIPFFGVVAIAYGVGAVQGAVRSFKARPTANSL